ncbi:MAG TPA: sulfite dehydrogenase, partial [Bryobacteraceae bacterium]|nr:sulfite dehydrogenase [Bryobacteraceae bacterium]
MTDEHPRELQFEESPTPPRGIASDIARPSDVTRRGLIGAGLGVAASAVPTGRAFSAEETESDSDLPPAVPQWQKQPGAPVMTPPYGVPSPREANVVRRPRAEAKPPTDLATYSNTPLQDLDGIVTPNGLHYERHHAGVPAIDPAQHRLIIHGLVERPMIFTMEDLTRFPLVSRLHFLECSGNSSPNWTAPKPELTVQDIHGLLSCAEWTGVPLAVVLAEAGVRPEAKWMLAEGADAAAMTRSIPIEKALDDALLAYRQNGERLRPEQGYPLRLFLPGWEGNTSVKWLRRLKLGAAPFETREETSKYTMVMPDHTIRQFDFVMEAKSVITFPSGGHRLAAPGFYEISGLAWSGAGKVVRVEVSTDDGRSWREAALQEPIMTKCLTRFRAPWRWDGAEAVLASRVTDSSGYVQPSREALLKVRDVRSYYHNNA